MSAPPTSAIHVHAAFMKWEWTPQSGRGEVLTAAAPAPAWLADEREAVRAALRMVQERRPFVQPNPGFMAFLRRNEAALRSLKTEIS